MKRGTRASVYPLLLVRCHRRLKRRLFVNALEGVRLGDDVQPVVERRRV